MKIVWVVARVPIEVMTLQYGVIVYLWSWGCLAVASVTWLSCYKPLEDFLTPFVLPCEHIIVAVLCERFIIMCKCFFIVLCESFFVVPFEDFVIVLYGRCVGFHFLQNDM